MSNQTGLNKCKECKISLLDDHYNFNTDRCNYCESRQYSLESSLYILRLIRSHKEQLESKLKYNNPELTFLYKINSNTSLDQAKKDLENAFNTYKKNEIENEVLKRQIEYCNDHLHIGQ